MCRWLLAMGLGLLLVQPLAAHTVKDALGQSFAAPGPYERIVSLVPSVTEMLYALKAQQRLVGVTSYATYPPGVTDNHKVVGDYQNPDLERIVALKPDLVVLQKAAGSQDLLKRLKALGLRPLVVAPRSWQDTLKLLHTFGELLDCSSRAQTLTAQMRHIKQQVAAHVANRQRPRTLICIMLQPLTVAGPDTLPGSLLDMAGGRNAYEGPQRYGQLSWEGLLALDPEVIVACPHPGEKQPLKRLRQWPQLKAVAHKRLYKVPADWLQRPGPRLRLGLQRLARQLHPQAALPESP